MSRPCQATVNLDALRHNYRLACELAPQSQTLAVVKANAYGHGAVVCAKALEPLAPALAVACIEEALELRLAGLTKPILLLEGIFSAEELALAAAENFWLMVANPFQLGAICQAKLNKPLRCWIKVDTGMHRLGFSPEQLADAFIQLKNSGNVEPNLLLASHFACADELQNNNTPQQLALFDQLSQGLDCEFSIANSAGILGWPKAHRNWNRPGIMLYGSSPFEHSHPEGDKLKAVMSLRSEVIAVRTIEAGESVGYGASWTADKNSTIATVAVGYGDGYPRVIPSGTPVIVNGQRCPLAGRVSMDMITVDVTELASANAPVKIGDPVELWGDQLNVNEVAACANTIGYELLTRMPLRATRVYQH